MGYWVINKHLESHLLISEGHPWGICDPLSRPKHSSWSVCTIPSVYPYQLWTSQPFCPDTLSQASSPPGFDWGILWNGFGIFVDWFCSPTNLTNLFLAAAWRGKAADCNQQWGKLAVLAENRPNTVHTVPWFVQFWGVFLCFGRKTRLQRGRIMAEFTPISKPQLPSGVGDKRKFWMSRSSKRQLRTRVF